MSGLADFGTGTEKDRRKALAMDVYSATAWVYARLGEDSDAWVGTAAAAIHEESTSIGRRYSDMLPRLAGDADSVSHRAWSRIKSLLAGDDGGS